MQDEATKRKHVMLDPVSKGQTVLLRNRPKGRNKIQDKWKEEVFEVTEVTWQRLQGDQQGNHTIMHHVTTQKRHMQGCMVYIERPKMAAVSRSTSHVATEQRYTVSWLVQIKVML